MNKVLYLNVPNSIRQLHKSIKGMKIYKGVWGTCKVEEYTSNFQFDLIVMNEGDWHASSDTLKTLSKETKLVVISDRKEILEMSDAIIHKNMELVTKTGRYDLKESPKDLYLWSLKEKIITKCMKCSSLAPSSQYNCSICGSHQVEISQAINHLSY